MCGQPKFLKHLDKLYASSQLSLLAVDEAHCISSWGHDFRPAYRQLYLVRRRFPLVPCLALTATATEKVKEDIRKQVKEVLCFFV